MAGHSGHGTAPGRGAGAAAPGPRQWTPDQLLAGILQGSPDYAVFATDAAGVVRVWSRGAEAVFGRPAQAAVGALAWWDLLAPRAGEEGAGEAKAPGPARPPQPPGWRAPLEETARTGRWAGPALGLLAGGGRVPLRAAVSPIPGEAGGPAGYVTLCFDVSAQERRLGELADARLADRGRFEASAAPMYVTDLLGVVTDVNQATVDMIGLPRERLIGTHLVEFADDRERAIAAFGQALREGRLVGLDFGARRADGEIVPVKVSGAVVTGRDGKPREVLITHADMTQEAALRERLQRAREYYRELAEAAACGVVVLDKDGFVAEVDGRAPGLSGFSSEELAGSAFAELFADPEQVRRLVRRALAGEDVGDAELGLADADGGQRRARVAFSRVSAPAESWNEPRLVAAVRDVTESSQLREQVARERAHCRHIIGTAPSGIVVCDLGQRISEVNATACELIGRPAEELIGSELRDCFADPVPVAELVDRALLAEEPAGAELAIAGGARRIEARVAILRDEEGKGQGVLAFLRDMSEEARLRQSVAAEREYNRAVLDSGTVALLRVDSHGVINDVNATAERMTGYSRRRLLGRRVATLFTDPQRARAGVEQAVADGYIAEYELTLEPPAGGQPFPTAFYGGLITNPRSGEPNVMIALRDMSAEKATREGLHLYHQSLYRATTDALVLTDLHGRITDVNRQMELVTGRSRADLSGSPFEACFIDRRRAHAFVEEVLRQGRVADVELTATRADGSDTVLWYSAGTFTDTEGKLEGVFASGRDVTERNRLQALQARMLARATELDRAKSEFVSRISHELRSPLTNLMGYLEVLRDDDSATLTADQLAMLAVVERNARRLLSLIEDLLLLARIESGVITLRYEQVDLGALVRQVHESFRPAIERGRLASQVEAEAGLTLEADPRQLERAAVNLVSNAIKFTPPGGQIQIRVSREGDQAVLEVRDTGMGVPVEEQPQLFTRFFRSSFSQERETQGTGLGLYIVKNVVDAHGGAVEVASRPGEGAAFIVRLPLRRSGGPA